MSKPAVRLFIGAAVLLMAVAAPAQSTVGYDAIIQHGKTQLQAGSTNLALVTGEQAIKLDTKRWEGYALAGGALMNLKRYDEAISRLTEAMDRAPQDKQAGLSELRKQCFAAESGTAPQPVPTSPAPRRSSSAPEATTTQAEIVLWKSIENGSTCDDFTAYLRQYPNGAFSALARAHLEVCLWKAIQSSSNPDDFKDYLLRYPNGKFAAQGQRRLGEIQEQAKQNAKRAVRDRQARTELVGTIWEGSYIHLKDNGKKDYAFTSILFFTSSTEYKAFNWWTTNSADRHLKNAESDALSLPLDEFEKKYKNHYELYVLAGWGTWDIVGQTITLTYKRCKDCKEQLSGTYTYTDTDGSIKGARGDHETWQLHRIGGHAFHAVETSGPATDSTRVGDNR